MANKKNSKKLATKKIKKMTVKKTAKPVHLAKKAKSARVGKTSPKKQTVRPKSVRIKKAVKKPVKKAVKPALAKKPVVAKKIASAVAPVHPGKAKVGMSRAEKKISQGGKVVPFKPKEEKKKSVVEELVYRGKQRGFITEDEILHAFPDAEKNIEELGNLYEKLEEVGVRVLGSDDMLKMETDKIVEDIEEEKAGRKKKKKEIDVPEEASSDLVQMYLRE
ncbi:MAG: RNA polymerase sigma factor region1.1 domain-containing protein, partial [bacterium]|nr:RNA polymerase sigma factor region1.1 domain-containing protein [bacterium]